MIFSFGVLAGFIPADDQPVFEVNMRSWKEWIIQKDGASIYLPVRFKMVSGEAEDTVIFYRKRSPAQVISIHHSGKEHEANTKAARKNIANLVFTSLLDDPEFNYSMASTPSPLQSLAGDPGYGFLLEEEDGEQYLWCFNLIWDKNGQLYTVISFCSPGFGPIQSGGKTLITSGEMNYGFGEIPHDQKAWKRTEIEQLGFSISLPRQFKLIYSGEEDTVHFRNRKSPKTMVTVARIGPDEVISRKDSRALARGVWLELIKTSSGSLHSLYEPSPVVNLDGIWGHQFAVYNNENGQKVITIYDMFWDSLGYTWLIGTTTGSAAMPDVAPSLTFRMTAGGADAMKKPFAEQASPSKSKTGITIDLCAEKIRRAYRNIR